MDEKIEAVHSYLVAKFPKGAKIVRTPPGQDRTKLEFDLKAVLFWISYAGSGRHRLYVADNFLDDNPPSTITDLLKQWEVADKLRKRGKKPLQVGSEGFHPVEG